MKRYLIILFLFLSSSLFATTYYVSQSGDNGANGLTTGTPWATLEYAELHATAAGDVVALKKGEIWIRSTAFRISHGGTLGNPIIWDGSLWGTGASPIIRSSNDRSSPNLSLLNVMDSYVTIRYIDGDGGNHINCNGFALSGPSDYYSPGAITKDIYYVTFDHCYVHRVGGNSSYAIPFVVHPENYDVYYPSFLYCTADSSGAHGISIYPQAIHYVPYPGGGRTVYNTLISHCNVYNYRLYSGNTGYGIHINHRCVNTTVEYCYVRDSLGRNHALAIDGFADDVAAGYFAINTVLRYNKIWSSGATMSNRSLFYFTLGGAKTVTMYGNIGINDDASSSHLGIYIIESSDWLGALFQIYNNDIYMARGRALYDGSTHAGTLISKNNIFYNNYTSLVSAYIRTAGQTHDHNLYFCPNNTTFTQEVSTTRNAAQTVTWEGTAKVTDPKFTTNFTDLTLQGTSPAIGAGVTISDWLLDYAGNLVNSPPEIGAYSYGTSPPSPPGPVIVSMTLTQHASYINVSAIVNPNNASTVIHFDYSLNEGYTIGWSVDNIEGVQTGIIDKTVTALISSLTPATNYYVRIVASNSGGASYGDWTLVSTLVYMDYLKGFGKMFKDSSKLLIFKN